MNVSLTPDVQKIISEQVRSGRYGSAEDVVTAAILALNQREQFGDLEAGELDSLLAQGEQSILSEGTLDGEEAYRLRRERRAHVRNLDA